MFHHGTCQVEVLTSVDRFLAYWPVPDHDSSISFALHRTRDHFRLFPSIVNTAGGTLVRVSLLNRLPLILGMRYMCTELSCVLDQVQGVGFQSGFRCRSDIQSHDVSVAFVSSSLILCETSALRVEDVTTAAYLSVVSSSNPRAQLSTRFPLTEGMKSTPLRGPKTNVKCATLILSNKQTIPQVSLASNILEFLKETQVLTF